MDKKFLEYLSDYIYDNPLKIHQHPGYTIGFTLYGNVPDDVEYLIDHPAYVFHLTIDPDRTRIKAQSVVLSKAGWTEDGDPFEEILWDDDHKLFKPLINHIQEKQLEDQEARLQKMQKGIIGGKFGSMDPLNIVVENYKKALIEEKQSQSRRVSAFGSHNPDLMDFTKPPEEDDDEE